jgi:hypothetical protein
MISIAAAAIFSELAGRLLSGNLEWFRALLFFFALMFGVAAVCLGRCPSQPLHVSGGTHPFRALRYARTDRLFRQTLVAWMLMGFANLMMLPLRVEYLANPKYEMALTVWWIALLTGVLPNLARLCLSPIWGWLFDHMNFFALRVTLNIGFALGILAFFTSNAVPGLILGALIYGASSSGGDVAWSLWVTKFSPPNRVADYMAVHTFFTGVRGLLAPLAGFQLATFLPLSVLAWFCIGLILLATLLLIPEIKFGKKARLASALVKEVSD